MTDRREPKAITVAELIKLLQELPQDAEVFSEGCDCYGECSGASLMADGTVLVERDRNA